VGEPDLQEQASLRAPLALSPSKGERAWIAIPLAVLAAHATGLQGGYQLDDWRVIVGDPRVQSLAAWWASMPGIRPLLKLTYALNNQSGLGLPGFHAVNLAIHASAAALAYLLLLRLGRRLGIEGRGVALLGALVFALHPVQAESVTYLSGRSASLSGALGLASALAFTAGRDEGRRWLVHLASPLLMALALCVKETAVVLPAALLLLEAVDLRRPFSWREALRATSAHLALAAAAAAAFLASPVYRSMLGRSLSLRPPGLQLLTQARATAWLAGQLVPLRGLSADPALEPVATASAGAVLLALVVLAVAAAALLLLRRRPAPALAAAWFLCWLAPQGWWLPRAEPASERQLYLALLGPAWLAALALSRLPWPRARAVTAGALLLLLGAATAARSRVYRDEVTFWTDAVQKAPGSARAHGNLGYALALACRPAEAGAAFLRAASLDPADPRPRVNLRLLREGALLPEEAEAVCRARGAESGARPTSAAPGAAPVPAP
jgi:protein O-mannosyl-transferase